MHQLKFNQTALNSARQWWLMALSLMSGLGFQFIAGCKSDGFTGIHSYESLGKLNCAVSPLAGHPSKTFDIAITGIDKYHGRIQRVIRTDNSAAETIDNITLIQEPGKPLIKEGDGSATTFTPDKSGNYQVVVKTLDYVDISGSCHFKVLEPCNQGMSRKGGYVGFIVDNSESHNVSDCPNRRIIGTHPYNPNDTISECQAKTARESAVDEATQLLGSFAENNPAATSLVSFAFFPNMKNDPRWYNTSKPEHRALLSTHLQSLRRPLGVTPYDDGLTSGIRIFSSLTEQTSSPDKPRILVFITDGFPTDKNPPQTLKLAKQLKETHKVRIISVMITGKSSQATLREKHKSFVRKFPMRPQTWMASTYQGQFEPYLLDLLGDGTAAHPSLLANISDQVIYIEDSRSLPRAIDKITADATLSCS